MYLILKKILTPEGREKGIFNVQTYAAFLYCMVVCDWTNIYSTFPMTKQFPLKVHLQYMSFLPYYTVCQL